VKKPADKPGFVVDNHSSSNTVARILKQSTRVQRGPRQRTPIWPYLSRKRPSAVCSLLH